MTTPEPVDPALVALAWGLIICLPFLVYMLTVAALNSLRIARRMEDIPTSTIAGAAQGYVEISGVARPLDEAPLKAPLTQAECVFWKYDAPLMLLARLKQQQALAGISRKAFLLDDGTGQCRVEFENPVIKLSGRRLVPLGSLMQAQQIHAQHRQRRQQETGLRRPPRPESAHEQEHEFVALTLSGFPNPVLEALIRPGDTVHVLGDFSTRQDTASREQHRIGEPSWSDDRPLVISRLSQKQAARQRRVYAALQAGGALLCLALLMPAYGYVSQLLSLGDIASLLRELLG